MFNESELITALQKADAAGDAEAARHFAQVIQEQRTAWSKANFFSNNDIVNKYGIEGAEAKLREQGKGYSVADDMGKGEKILTGIGRGFTDVGQGSKQIGLRVGNFFGLTDDETVQNYDKKIRSENAQFEKDFADDWYAKGGRITGQIAATAPAGMGVGALMKPVAGSSRMINALNYGKQGAAVGATEAALMPTLTDDFVSEKASQLGLGAAFGGVLGTGTGLLKGGKELMQDGVGATVQNAVNKGAKNKIARAFVGDSAERAEREALSARTGVALTPAEKSGSRLGQGLESLAEQSLITADDVLEKSTIPSLNQLKDYALKQADSISKTVQTSDQVGIKVQQLTNTITNKLVQSRSEIGRKLYGEIDNMAKGQKIVKPDGVKQVFMEILEETEGVAGSDLQKVANQAKKMMSSFEDGMTAKQALNQLQAWSSKKSGKLFKDIEGFGVDDVYKKRLSDALLADMDNVAGGLGDKVRIANQAWRKGSEEISALEASVLGRVAGKNLSSEINGFINNSIPPEKVVDTLKRARPTEIKAAIKYMDKFDPQMSKEFKANYIRMAVEDAMQNANSSGAQQVFNPTQLLNSLGVKGGRAGVEGIDKLKAIFNDVPGGKQFVKDIIELSRIKADAFGRNFSGTATQNEANRLLSSVGSFFTGFMDFGKQSLGTLGHTLGIKSVARNMIENTPFNKTINAATNAGGYSAMPAGAIVNQVQNDGR